MTRQEVKNLLPVLQAYVQGKTIQATPKGDGKIWVDVCKTDTLSFSLFNYRIKPSPTYRPFANAEECWEEMQKHQPFGWVKKGDKTKMLITVVDEKCSINSDGVRNSFDYIMNYYTFADGTPFGVKVEEE